MTKHEPRTEADHELCGRYRAMTGKSWEDAEAWYDETVRAYVAAVNARLEFRTWLVYATAQIDWIAKGLELEQRRILYGPFNSDMRDAGWWRKL